MTLNNKIHIGWLKILFYTVPEKLTDNQRLELIELFKNIDENNAHIDYLYNLISDIKDETLKYEVLLKHWKSLYAPYLKIIIHTFSDEIKIRIIKDFFLNHNNNFNLQYEGICNLILMLPLEKEVELIKEKVFNSDLNTHYNLLKKIAVKLKPEEVFDLINEAKEEIIEYDIVNNTSIFAYYIMLINDEELFVRALCENKEYIGNIFSEMIKKSFDVYNSKKRKENLDKFMTTFASLYDQGEINFEIFFDEQFQPDEALELQGILLYSKNLSENDRKLVIDNLYKIKSELKEDERKKIIELFVSGNIDPTTFSNIKTTLDYNVWENYFEKNNIVYSQSFTERISINVLNNINNVYINRIISLIANKYGDKVRIDMIEIAFTMYLTLGYNRTLDVLKGKYGTIDYYYLSGLFTNYDLRFIEFEQKDKKMQPILNERLINIVMGTSPLAMDTPLKKLIEGKLTNNSDEMFFLRNLSGISNNWQIIEEEYARKDTASKLSVKLNIKTIVEIYKNLSTIENRSLDHDLAQTDFYKYAGRDLKYTKGKTRKEIIARGVALSKRMERVDSKKFPLISISQNGYNLQVLPPKDRSIISVGYETGCCFRPCGNADDFGKDTSLLSYCTSTEYGGAIVLKDENGKTIFFSPIIRNGNVLIIHSIESADNDIQNDIGGEKSRILHEMLVEYAKRTIETSASVEENPIEVVLLGNLHYVDKSFSKGTINNMIPPYTEDSSFDGMYNNLDLGFSIIATSSSFSEIKLGSVSHEYRHEKQIINEIYIRADKISEIDYCIKLKSHIIDLTNLLNSTPYEQRGSIIDEINKLKKEYRNLFRKHIADIEKKEKINYIINEINNNGLNKQNSTIEDINYLKYSNRWYIALNEAGEIEFNYTEYGKEECMKELTEIKSNINQMQL